MSEMNAVLHDCAKSSLNGTAPAALPSKFLNERPPTVIVRGQSTVSSGPQPVAQQRRGGDDLERRAGRVAALERAVVGRVAGPVGDGEHVAGRRLHGHQRRLVRRGRRAPPRRRAGRRRERRAQRPARPAAPCAAAWSTGTPSSRITTLRVGRAAEPLLVAGLEARLADRVAGRARAPELLELLGGDRADAAEQRAGEVAALGQRGRAVDRQRARERRRARSLTRA